MTAELTGVVESSPDLLGSCEYSPEIIVDLMTGGGGGTMDHSKLNNRDAEDAHPMSAITGLTKKIGEKMDNEFLSNMEIQAILDS